MVQQVKSLMGIDTDPKFELAFETLFDQAPIIGKILTSYKIHTLGQRLKLHDKKINEISEKVNQIEDSDFLDIVKNFLFPIILQELLDEDEDNKIGYFLDGFGQVVENCISDKSKILIYYDVLKELRFIEIEYLISFSSASQRAKNRKFYEDRVFPKSIFDTKDFMEMRFAIENKLERLGLIDTGRLISYNQIMKKINDKLKVSGRGIATNDERDQVKITTFGYKFLNFFYLLDRFE